MDFKPSTPILKKHIKAEEEKFVIKEECDIQNLLPDTIPKCFSSNDSSIFAQHVSFARHEDSNFCMRGSFPCSDFNLNALTSAAELAQRAEMHSIGGQTYIAPSLPHPSMNGSSLNSIADSTGNSVDERKKRSRERNRLHAKKTRERKKMQMQALQLRIKQLQKEEDHLRRMLEERDTAQALLSMSGKSSPCLVENQPDTHYNDNLETVLRELQKLDGVATMEGSEEEIMENTSKRAKSKLSVQERQRIRRERNRMHAKRTRDRKKLFFEASALIIQRMEMENTKLCKKLGIARLPTVQNTEATQADVEKVLAELADGPLTMKKLKRMTAKDSKLDEKPGEPLISKIGNCSYTSQNFLPYRNNQTLSANMDGIVTHS